MEGLPLLLLLLLLGWVLLRVVLLLVLLRRVSAAAHGGGRLLLVLVLVRRHPLVLLRGVRKLPHWLNALLLWRRWHVGRPLWLLLCLLLLLGQPHSLPLHARRRGWRHRAVTVHHCGSPWADRLPLLPRPLLHLAWLQGLHVGGLLLHHVREGRCHVLLLPLLCLLAVLLRVPHRLPRLRLRLLLHQRLLLLGHHVVLQQHWVGGRRVLQLLQQLLAGGDAGVQPLPLCLCSRHVRQKALLGFLCLQQSPCQLSIQRRQLCLLGIETLLLRRLQLSLLRQRLLLLHQLLLQGCQALRLALSGLLGLALLLGCRRVPAGGEGGQWKEGEGDGSAAKTRGAAGAEATQRMEALQASSPKPQACFPQAWRHAR